MTIDLGELTTVEPVPVPLSRLFPRSRRRLIRLVAVIVVLLATSVSSAPAFGTPPRPVGSLPIGLNARFLVTGAQAIVMDMVGNRSRISAYGLPGGGRRWTSALGGNTNNAQAFALGSTVVAVTPMPNGNTTYAAGFDLRTGHLAWEHQVDAAFAVGRIILEYVPGELTGERLRGIDPATGAPVWSVDLPSDCTNQLDSSTQATVTALVEMCPDDGTIRRLDLITGTIVARATFDVPEANDFSLPGPPSATFIDDVLLVAQDSADRTWVSAFRSTDLTPLWAQTPLESLAAFQSCGPDLCIDLVDGRLDKVDPDTGRARRPGDDPPTHTVSYRSDISAPIGTTMLIIAGPGRDGVELIPSPRVDFALSVPEGTAVRLMNAGDGDTWIARIVRHADSVSTRLLWDLPRFGGGCVVAGSYLACTGSATRVTLWRVPG